MMYMLFVHSLCLALQVSPWRWGSQRTQHSPSMSTTSGHEEDVRLAHAIGDEPSVQAYLSLLARRTAAYMRQRDMRLSRSSHVDHDKHARVEQMVSSCAVYSPSESSKASFAGRVETLEQAVGVFDGYGNAREIMCNVYRFGVAVLLKDLVGSAALDVTTLEELYTAAGMGESGLAEMRRALALARARTTAPCNRSLHDFTPAPARPASVAASHVRCWTQRANSGICHGRPYTSSFTRMAGGAIRQALGGQTRRGLSSSRLAAGSARSKPCIASSQTTIASLPCAIGQALEVARSQEKPNSLPPAV